MYAFKNWNLKRVRGLHLIGNVIYRIKKFRNYSKKKFRVWTVMRPTKWFSFHINCESLANVNFALSEKKYQETGGIPAPGSTDDILELIMGKVIFQHFFFLNYLCINFFKVIIFFSRLFYIYDMGWSSL